MKVRVLGCSGGIGGRHLRTTSLLVNHDTLIDCGTGVEELSMKELMAIDHVYLTHSHLDHLATLPMLVDTVGEFRSRPIVVHGTRETLQALRQHIFNWQIWPDFAEIPNKSAPFMQYREITVGQTLTLFEGRVTVLPAVHTVPAVGYLLDSGRSALAFTGDTGINPEFWPIINRVPHLRYLIIETAFPDTQRALAAASKHLCPSDLAAELAHLTVAPEVFVTHLKPGHIEETMGEIEQKAGAFKPNMLYNHQLFEF